MATNPLMIVNNFNVNRTIIPSETQSPLIVDADRVLPLAISFKPLQSISGWNPQIVKSAGCSQHFQFAPRDTFKRLKAADFFVPAESLGVCTSEALDHTVINIPNNGTAQRSLDNNAANSPNAPSIDWQRLRNSGGST